MCRSPRSNTQDADYSLQSAYLRTLRNKSGLLSSYQEHSFQIVNTLAFETLFLLV